MSAMMSSPMGHVRIVAGILDNAGLGAAFPQFGKRQREARGSAARQDRDRVGEPIGQQGGKKPCAPPPRTGAGRPAVP
jgi:hypothetical protein